MTAHPNFPLQGVIGVVANSADELDIADSSELQCVELRADLLLDAGLSLDDVIRLIERARELGINSLFTLRHPSHGGVFQGSEDERVTINRLALRAGADIIDLEWQSEASGTFLKENAPIILSHHDFEAMPNSMELAKITTAMQKENPAAIKVVPTASSTADAITMLQWVNQSENEIVRIGFAMGEAGACSRILTTLCGGAITYSSFGPAVAPGQIELELLLETYRVNDFTNDTTVIAITTDADERDHQIRLMNNRHQQQKADCVAVGFPSNAGSLLREHQQLLQIVDIKAL